MSPVLIAQLPLPADVTNLARVLMALARAYPHCVAKLGRRPGDSVPTVDVWWTPPREDVGG